MTPYDVESPHKLLVHRNSRSTHDQEDEDIIGYDEDSALVKARDQRRAKLKRRAMACSALLLLYALVRLVQSVVVVPSPAWQPSPPQRQESLDRWRQQQFALVQRSATSRHSTSRHADEVAARSDRGGCAEFRSHAEARNLSSNVRTLFIGDSFTTTSELPALYRQLVRESMPRATVEVQTIAADGLTLFDHASPPTAAAASRTVFDRQHWTHVVLQEAPWVPPQIALQVEAGEAFVPPPPRASAAAIDPDSGTAVHRSRVAVRVLAAKASFLGAEAVVLLQTPAWREGDAKDTHLDGFDRMQVRMAAGYHVLAAEARQAVADSLPGFPHFNAPRHREHARGGGTGARVRVAPVGDGFRSLHAARSTNGTTPASDPDSPELFGRLFSDDGRQLSTLGAHLAAAVLVYSLHGLEPSLPAEHAENAVEMEHLKSAAKAAVGDCSPLQADYAWQT